EQFWHPGGEVTALSPQCFRIGSRVQLTVADNAEVSLNAGGEHGWRSCAYGKKSATQVLVASSRRGLPVVLAAALAIPDGASIFNLGLRRKDSEIHLTLDGDRTWLVRFAPQGAPR